MPRHGAHGAAWADSATAHRRSQLSQFVQDERVVAHYDELIGRINALIVSGLRASLSMSDCLIRLAVST